MTEQEINARFAEINAREPEEPSAEDIRAIQAAQNESAVSLEELKAELEQYSGKIILRIPRSLHKQLKEAAAIEGVSLNQYMLYKLAH
ncbi:toxin-antitoxin system HicB family antitoxin [bacterium]|nr:toxin-antitoxin system HicB family antitoxin [bacterium]